MGRVVKEIGEGVTRHYWYPGEKRDWVQAALTVGSGLGVALVTLVMLRSGLAAAVLGTSTSACVAGVNMGRRDTRSFTDFPGFAAARRDVVVDTGRAAWRAVLKGVGAAAAAVLIMNLPPSGFVADWVLPIVPAIVGALAHQCGMFYERFAQDTAKAAAAQASQGRVQPAAGTG